MVPPAVPPHRSTARRDLLALAALGLLAFALARRFALFDRLVEAGRRLEGAGVDALIVTVLVLAFGLTVYAWRRWWEARRALSDRLQAEGALGASEARLHLLTRQLPAFLWTTDADLRLDSFAGGGFRSGGIDPRGRVGLTVAAFFGTADPAFPPLAAHRRALGDEPSEYPLRRDGRAYEVRVEPLRDADGAIVGTLGLGVDVTERERAAMALRESEARFRALFEHAAIGIGLADLDRRPLMVNPALARLTGRDGDTPDGHGLGRATHPADAARDAALFAELVAGRRDHYQLEKRYLHPDGTLACGRLTTSLVRDAAGTPQYAIGMVEDITARVAADAALRASEARYHAVVAQAAEGIFLFNTTSKHLQEANPALLRLLGYTEAEIVALTLYDLIAHDRASVDANVASIIATGRHAIGEREYRRKDGTVVPVEVSATALMLGEERLLCVVVRDISARRAADAALQASEARLQAVVTNLPVLVFALDPAGVVTFAAGKGLAALGLTPEAVVGRAVDTLLADAPTLARDVRRALAGEECVAVAVLGGVTLEARHTPVRGATGAVVGAISVAIDVTARARAEAERDEARRRLLVGREAAQITLARELHDGPVQELYGLALQLATLVDDLPNDDRRAWLDARLGALERLANALHAISRDLRPPMLAPFGLAVALREHARRVGQSHPGLTLHLDLMPDPPAVPESTGLALFRIVQEALWNAVRHAAAETVWVRLAWVSTTIAVEIRDDGVGFAPPESLSALTAHGHLGLAGASERAEALGGCLTVESAPGRGTTVRATIPRPMAE